MSRLASFLVLIGSIIVIGFLFFRVMASFLLPLFLAVLLVVIFQPVHRRVLARCKGRLHVAAAVTSSLVLLIVLLPLLVIIFMAAAEGSALIARQNPNELRERIGRARDRFEILRLPHARQLRSAENAMADLVASSEESNPDSSRPAIAGVLEQSQQWWTLCTAATASADAKCGAIRDALERARVTGDEALSPAEYRAAIRSAAADFHVLKIELLGGELRAWIKDIANPTEEDLQKQVRGSLENAKGAVFSLGGRTTAMIGGIVIGAVIMVVALYFFLADGPRMVDTVMRLSPLEDRYERELLEDFTNVSRAVVLATLLSAMAQGLLAGLGYYLAGFHSVVLLMLITSLLAMVPFVGAAAVWAPAALWLYFIDERPAAAVLLAIYGAAVVSSIDNLIKPLVLHGKSRLHPLLALLSVLGGVKALGPIGIVVGPMSVAFLQTLLNILHRELTQLDHEKDLHQTQHSTR